MKTEIQRQRDSKNGIMGLTHEFDKDIGKIIAKGKINQEIDPEFLLKQRVPFIEKLNQVKETIEQMVGQIAALPEVFGEEVKHFIEIQKQSNDFIKREGLEKTLAERKKDYQIMLDDWEEQEILLNQYLEYKKQKSDDATENK